MTALTSDPAATATGDPGGPALHFVQHVLAMPAVQARLGACEMPEAYLAAARDVTGAAGIAFDAELPEPMLHFPPVTCDRWPGPGWLPARSLRSAGGLAFDWAWFGTEPLAEPFYEDSVRRVATRPFNRMVRLRTTLDALVADPAARAAPPPSGLVFHMSRCGSTLVARMLRAVAGHAVASEPEPLDAVVQWARGGMAEERRIAALRAVVAALGRDRTGTQTRFFVKLDCWHMLDLPLFRAAFPDVPWIFLYRDPLEVMVSHAARPGMQTVPGMLAGDPFGLDSAGLGARDHAAAVLARVCAAALQHWPLGGGRLVAYPEIAAAMQDAIPRHFGFIPTATERAAMTAAAKRDAKAPDVAFVPDSARKREAADAVIRAAVAERLAPTHAGLQALRAMQG